MSNVAKNGLHLCPQKLHQHGLAILSTKVVLVERVCNFTSAKVIVGEGLQLCTCKSCACNVVRSAFDLFSSPGERVLGRTTFNNL